MPRKSQQKTTVAPFHNLRPTDLELSRAELIRRRSAIEAVGHAQSVDDVHAVRRVFVAIHVARLDLVVDVVCDQLNHKQRGNAGIRASCAF